ncbi:hypothetical protein nbrc107696_19860 [Gordonia spumicola]|uniref:DUF998 domain-containing protein n=1 Tax=Gordonia spumicola TaxID=589161 RepID=A0A7I9V8W8_9ACTN|nr:hypothetical protein [Gordonia spumicola]GEE01540.1 hypothetical protein nbrc107696_19860 [Gordonia spumicola]
MIVNPAHGSSLSTAFRVDVVVALVGAVTAAGAHLLPWYASAIRPASTVDGFGRASDPGVMQHANHLQWMIGVGVVGALILLVVRVCGGSDDAWRHAATVVAALSGVGALFAVLAVPDDMVRADGLWIAATGAAVTAVGTLLLRRNLA